jgi:hypothetical protein
MYSSHIVVSAGLKKLSESRKKRFFLCKKV